MKTAIDHAGRVVIPKEVRERAALRPGTALEIRYEDGRVIIEPAATKVRMERKGRFVVAVPEESTDRLRTEVVRETRSKVRDERDGRK